MGRFRRATAHLALVGVLWPWLASAQAVTGSIGGTVTDQQGQVVPGVTITIINEATKDERVAVSNERGEFQVTNLQPTTYTVRATLESFRTHGAPTWC